MRDIVERLRAENDRLRRTKKALRQSRDCWLMKVVEQSTEITRLRAALREITDFEVFGFAITDTHSGGDVFCEGTNRFVREDDVVKIRRIARAALGDRKEVDWGMPAGKEEW